MATHTTYSDTKGKYVIVKKGDTLSEIAKELLGSGTKASYTKLANWNGISNPNNICVGDKIYYELSGSGSNTPSRKASNDDPNRAKITKFGLRANSDNELVATWTWSKHSDTDKYEVWWGYYDGTKTAGGGMLWFDGQTSSITNTYDTYTIPDNAFNVCFRVKPIAKTDKDGDKEVPRFTAQWSKEQWWGVKTPFDVPQAPSVEIKNNVLTAKLENIDIPGANHIWFEVVKNNKSVCARGAGKIAYAQTSFSCEVAPGGEYKVRCYAFYSTDLTKNPKGQDGQWSEWGPYSSTAYSDLVSTHITEIRATSVKSVHIAWAEVVGAESYDIEYAEKKEHFDYTSLPKSVTGIKQTPTELHDLASGFKYFFRVKAVGENGSSSAWSEIESVVVGAKPAAPTTWSSSTSAVIGEEVVLYWVHNSEDQSSQTSAELELTINSEVQKPTITIKNTTDEDKKDKTSSCIIDTENGLVRWTDDDGPHQFNPDSEIIDGAKLQWRVRTAGVTNQYGDWSVSRTVDINESPNLTISLAKPVYYLVECTLDTTTDTCTYTKTEEIITPVLGEALEGVLIENNNQVYRTIGDDEEFVYYCCEVVDAKPDGDEHIHTVESFPFYISALPDATGQHPVGYHISVVTNEPYETTDSLGNLKMVTAGTQVYSQYFDVTRALLTEFSAKNIDLENNMTYTLNCVVSMNTGLKAEASLVFKVAWTETVVAPNAEISVDMGNLSASIRPYCETRSLVYRGVEKSGRTYTTTDLIYDFLSGEEVKGAYTIGRRVYYIVEQHDDAYMKTSTAVSISSGTIVKDAITETGEQVYRTTTADGDEMFYCSVLEEVGRQVYTSFDDDGNVIYYCYGEERTPITNIYLSVYRREYDGTFTELASMLDGKNNTAIVDPHPALDMARYRIVATSKDTGAVGYYDMPGVPVGGGAVVIQWDEAWSSYETKESYKMAEPAWTGSMLKLPYNIDVSDNISPEVQLVEYVGRKYPVSYYGTQLGHSASWNVAIRSDDVETIYGLRRLAMWMGDVYVREPSGIGYWANIGVSFSQKYSDLTIPVSLSIKRVEGGA